MAPTRMVAEELHVDDARQVGKQACRFHGLGAEATLVQRDEPGAWEGEQPGDLWELPDARIARPRVARVLDAEPGTGLGQGEGELEGGLQEEVPQVDRLLLGPG